ncbi:MAG: glycosyltransferase family 2 protein [Salinibacterium sp.]|nr:glycosyltransferase family 2 protein [Salinibacterium sp.]
MSPTATVAILTFNGERYLRDILLALRTQRLDGEFEVLVIDSGSTDSTLDIIAEFPEVRLHQIPNSEFGHGKTRNLAAQLAAGEFVVYLTHDAIPADDFWLESLLAPFASFPGVVGVVGRHIPRPDCFPLLKYEIRRAFDSQGVDFATTISYQDPKYDRDLRYGSPARLYFYSDVNSAARRRYLTEQLPYQDVAYAEDQLFAEDFMTLGGLKAYTPWGAVIHSNDLSYSEYKKRLFDEFVGLRLAGAVMPPASHGFRAFVRAVILDPIDIVQDREYSTARKLYWLLVNPFFHLAKFRSTRRARRIDLSNPKVLEKLSLEAQRKSA